MLSVYFKTDAGVSSGHGIPVVKIVEDGVPKILLGQYNAGAIIAGIETADQLTAGLRKLMSNPLLNVNGNIIEFTRFYVAIPEKLPTSYCCIL